MARLACAFLLGAVLQATVLHAQDMARPHLRAHRAAADVRIDGRLDDAAWLGADSIANLTQTEPVEGAAPAGRTVVRVLAFPDALVFGIHAYDSEPGRITSFSRERDAPLYDEDHVRIVLDPYLDGRSGYVFIVNPEGARLDALVVENGEEEDESWDAIWEARTTRDSSGWTAEVRIPAHSLLFKPGLTTWGFNVMRHVERLIENDRWAAPDRDIKFYQMTRAGFLDDIPPFDLGIGLSVRPSLKATGGYADAGMPFSSRGDWALDVTQRIGSNSLSSLTLNTDFAETEVDTRRTNLTRFPLFFPEKRTFFLEGSDVFDFGLGTGDDLRPFFSRRIGLLEGNEVPLDAGLKVNGRNAGTSYGALAVRTHDLDTLPTGTTMGVVRVRQNVLRESTVGMIGTYGDPLGARDSWLAGADATYQTTHFRGNRNVLFGAWLLGMRRDTLAGDRSAWGAKLDYPNDLVDAALTFKRIGDDFDPSLGFVPRRGVSIWSLNGVYRPRPTRPVMGLHVNQMFNEWMLQLVTDPGGEWQSYEAFFAPVNWQLDSGDRFEFNWVPTGERLDAPFDIADGVVIDPGEYRWTRWRVETELAGKRRLSGQLTWWFGDFYGGRLNEYQVESRWRVSRLVILEMDATRNEGRLPQGNFTQQVVGTRMRLDFSPDLQLNSYLQYDNESDTFGTNTRVRWTFTPQSDLFVVYNHNAFEFTDPLSPTRRLWRFAGNQLLVKVQYAFLY